MGSVSSIAGLRSDPERLLSSSAAQHALELALLGSLRTLPVPPDAKDLVWDALGVQAIGTGVTAVAHSSSWAAAFWRGTLQALLTSKTAVALPVIIAALGAGALQYQKSATQTSVIADRAPSTHAASSPMPSLEASDSNAPDASLIEALATRGKAEAAAREARRFVAVHPESPHAIQLRRFVDLN
jgi:hypothetical protein